MAQPNNTHSKHECVQIYFSQPYVLGEYITIYIYVNGRWNKRQRVKEIKLEKMDSKLKHAPQHSKIQHRTPEYSVARHTKAKLSTVHHSTAHQMLELKHIKWERAQIKKSSHSQITFILKDIIIFLL